LPVSGEISLQLILMLIMLVPPPLSRSIVMHLVERLDKFDQAEPLRDLTGSKLILVRIPKSAATNRVAPGSVMANAKSGEADIPIPHLVLKCCEVPF
jgi:hypothetical protein